MSTHATQNLLSLASDVLTGAPRTEPKTRLPDRPEQSEPHIERDDEPRLPNYGRSAGKPIASADLATLNYYAAMCGRSLSDPRKRVFWAKDRAMLALLEAEITRRKGEGNG